MFENYSFADLWANLYKKKKINLIALVIIFLAIVFPVSYQAITSKSIIRNDMSYSNYAIYKITAPDKEWKTESNVKNDQYSYFYSRLILSNLNGAFLFSDVSDADVARYASELSSNATQLRNSDQDFWEKKVVVNNMGDYTGVSAKILTTSAGLNALIEKKLDALIEEYNNTFPGVTIEKINSVSSQGEGEASESTVSNFNMKQLLLRIIVVFVLALFIVVFLNFAVYLFNPTMNRAGDFKKYDIDRVYEVENIAALAALVAYKVKQAGDLIVVTSNKKVRAALQANNIPVEDANDYAHLADKQQYLFVEEFGQTRYGQFEKTLQELKNFDKTIDGVAALPL